MRWAIYVKQSKFLFNFRHRCYEFVEQSILVFALYEKRIVLLKWNIMYKVMDCLAYSFFLTIYRAQYGFSSWNCLDNNAKHVNLHGSGG